MQSYRTRQRLLNNEIYALKKEIAQLKSNNSLEELEKWMLKDKDMISVNEMFILEKIQQLKNK